MKNESLLISKGTEKELVQEFSTTDHPVELDSSGILTKKLELINSLKS